MVSDELKVGVCSECGQKLLLTADDCWHPYTVERACPPNILVNGVQRPAWGEGFGRPGRDKWQEKP